MQKQIEEKYLRAWRDAVKRYNSSKTTEEQIKNFKKLVKIAPKVGISPESLLARVVQASLEAEDGSEV